MLYLVSDYHAGIPQYIIHITLNVTHHYLIFINKDQFMLVCSILFINKFSLLSELNHVIIFEMYFVDTFLSTLCDIYMHSELVRWPASRRIYILLKLRCMYCTIGLITFCIITIIYILVWPNSMISKEWRWCNTSKINIERTQKLMIIIQSI